MESSKSQSKSSSFTENSIYRNENSDQTSNNNGLYNTNIIQTSDDLEANLKPKSYYSSYEQTQNDDLRNILDSRKEENNYKNGFIKQNNGYYNAPRNIFLGDKPDPVGQFKLGHEGIYSTLTKNRILSYNIPPEKMESMISIDKMFQKNYPMTKEKRTPRPPNAFIIYRKEKQADVLKKNQGVSNKEISKIIGKMWREESQEVKDTYKGKAEVEKNNHKKKFPDYKYKPRKSKKNIRPESEIAYTKNNLYETAINDRIVYNQLGGYVPEDINEINQGMNGTNGYNPMIYGLPDISNGSFSNHPPHIKDYIRIQRPATVKIQSYPEQYIQNQLTSQMGNFENVDFYQNNGISNYPNQFGISQSNANAFTQGILLSPTSNKGNNQIGGYSRSQTGEVLDFEGVASTSDSSYMSNFIPKTVAKIQAMYPDNDHIVDFHLSQIQNNGNMGIGYIRNNNNLYHYQQNQFIEGNYDGGIEQQSNTIGNEIQPHFIGTGIVNQNRGFQVFDSENNNSQNDATEKYSSYINKNYMVRDNDFDQNYNETASNQLREIVAQVSNQDQSKPHNEALLQPNGQRQKSQEQTNGQSFIQVQGHQNKIKGVNSTSQDPMIYQPNSMFSIPLITEFHGNSA
ncbi:hypothetical protein BB559_004131 [Furculomyces boomerangus]|uniref:HMG box domain-containing protein n=1 Tax=Furculomyces boomerangus TaxID=61424 RepID=A0A2T9YGH7_9FUNG|nr:hypothetical protein BB559_004131 [Furculomyces boomerangus]